jgi:hypothetical protein
MKQQKLSFRFTGKRDISSLPSKAQVHARDSPCGICVLQGDTGRGFSLTKRTEIVWTWITVALTPICRIHPSIIKKEISLRPVFKYYPPKK